MTSLMRRLSVAIVTYNSADILPDCLDSLAAGLAGIETTRVWVVDNASADSSVAIARRHPARPEVIVMGRNAGYAAAINAASEACGPDDVLLVLNPDVRLFPGSARRLLDALETGGTGVAAPRLVDGNSETWHSLRREPSLGSAVAEAFLGGRLAGRLGIGESIADRRLYENGGYVDWASGAALAIAPAARRKAGAWDESFFLYSEEVDYQRRIRECGFRVAYVPAAVMMHTGGDYAVNPRLSALLTANRVRYFRRHHRSVETLLYRLVLGAAAALRSLNSRASRAAMLAALKPWRPPPETLQGLDIKPRRIGAGDAT